MDYIFNIVVEAKNQGVNLEELTFKQAEVFSPYMELSNENINFTEVKKEIELNPYYRFYEIFKDLFNPNYNQYQELREVLLDLVIHFLARIDLKLGMDKLEFQKKFIYQEIKKGGFGNTVKEGINHFDFAGKNVLLENIHKFYIVEDHVQSLKDSVERIFKDSIFYISNDNVNEFILYIEAPKSKENLMKLEVIKELFLPLKFDLITYWEKHFGIIGVEKTMRIEQNSIY